MKVFVAALSVSAVAAFNPAPFAARGKWIIEKLHNEEGVFEHSRNKSWMPFVEAMISVFKYVFTVCIWPV